MKKNIPKFPERIVIELTPLCNLSCSMCPRHYIKETDGYMDPKLYKKLIDEIKTENSEAIILPFWRGESCMHPNFIELIEYTLQQELRVHISTNGHYMVREVMDIFYRCEFITFSIHDNRGYKNALNFISNKPDPRMCSTQISFVDVEKTTQKFLKECSTSPNLQGFDSIRLYHEHSIDGVFGKSSVENSHNRIFCPKLEHTFVIGADGHYSRCNHIWELEQDRSLYELTIKDVWKGDRIEEIRNQYPDNKCTPCDQWSGNTNGESWRVSKDGKVDHTVYSVAE
jgi:organic radical activating enzyme